MRLFAILICAMISTTAHAFSLSWGPGGGPSFLTPAQQQQFISMLNDQLAPQVKTQKELARGLANANTFAADAGSLDSHQNYDWFALEAGPALGVQLPPFHFSTSPTAIYNQIKDNGSNSIDNNRDIYAGFAGAAAISFGFNVGHLGLHPFGHNLYVSAKYFSYTETASNLTASVRTMGVGVNYELVRGNYLFGNKHVGGLVGWSGLSLGVGLTRNENKVSYNLDSLPGNITTQNISLGGYDITTSLGQNPVLGISTDVWIVPVSLTTSFSLLYILDIMVGAGVDFNHGTSNINVVVPANISASGTNQTATLILNASTLGVAPDFIREKIMTSVGFGTGPFKVDVPVAYYFGHGFSAGITTGIVW